MLEFLSLNSIDPSGFEWDWRRSWYSEREAPMLFHRTAGFYFMVDFGSNSIGIEYSPGEIRPVVQADYGTGDWAYARPHLADWAQSLARELSAPDLWSELSRQGELLGDSGYDEHPNSPFTEEELDRVKATLEEIRELAAASFLLQMRHRRSLSTSALNTWKARRGASDVLTGGTCSSRRSCSWSSRRSLRRRRLRMSDW